MKRILSILTSVSLLFLIGCKKGDTAGDFAALGIGSYVTKVAVGNGIIDYSNLAASKVDVTVREYGTPVDKIKVYVSKGNATTDKSVWKLAKEFTYSGDTKLELTATEIATALGIPVTGLETGATYTMYNQVISKDGQVHDISNMNSAMYGSPNYNTLMTWQAAVICPYTGGMTGSFRIVVDDWVDWSPGDIVQVTAGGANQLNLSQIWPNPAYGVTVNPFLININPATGAVTIPSGVRIGNYTCCGFFLDTGTGSTGFVFSCTGDIKLRVRLTAPPFGDQGFFNLILKKL